MNTNKMVEELEEFLSSNVLVDLKDEGELKTALKEAIEKVKQAMFLVSVDQIQQIEFNREATPIQPDVDYQTGNLIAANVEGNQLTGVVVGSAAGGVKYYIEDDTLKLELCHYTLAVYFPDLEEVRYKHDFEIIDGSDIQVGSELSHFISSKYKNIAGDDMSNEGVDMSNSAEN